METPTVVAARSAPARNSRANGESNSAGITAIVCCASPRIRPVMTTARPAAGGPPAHPESAAAIVTIIRRNNRRCMTPHDTVFAEKRTPSILSGMSTQIADRIDSLRAYMGNRGFHAWIVPSTDPHLGEYLPARWQARSWISGFSGSAGTIVVTADGAGLWTDSRYYLEAEQALQGSGIELHRLGMPGVMDYPAWLAKTLPAESVVGVAAETIALSAFRTLESVLRRGGISLRAGDDPFAHIWADRPELPSDGAYLLEESLTGRSRAQKLTDLRSALAARDATHGLVASLDDIAWLLNLRGSDVPFNPLVCGYVLVTPDETEFCVDRAKFSAEAVGELERDGIRFCPYDAIEELLRTLPTDAALFLDPARTNMALATAVPASVSGVEAPHLVTSWKAIKNETEQNHIRRSHVRDGVALTRFLCWLDSAWQAGDLTELSVTEVLREFRSAEDHYVGESFRTIAGFGPHGAVVHYSVTPESSLPIRPDNLLLLDSGAHYRDGTTDITRVIPIGTPTDEQRADFTLVLKAHIALATARFPTGTNGHRLDMIARSVLWRHLRNYGHGTGHGVGFFLNVHEGPQRIAAEPNDAALLPGMFTSNEPGIYRTGRYGIRIENLMLTRPPEESEFGSFLSFETVSLCPIDHRLIDESLLTDEERTWVNDYHARVRGELLPHLAGADAEWLTRNTEPL
ncbi:MAG: aminopeptidase P family protein [Spirochaetaceae bacterium]|nr:MAG: aminopeptidase P family protein [Spirochaetaceae bacterium]